jgi:hypothetical protein
MNEPTAHKDCFEKFVCPSFSLSPRREEGWGEGGAFHGVRVGRRLVFNSFEKFLKVVAQAFQPVRN